MAETQKERIMRSLGVSAEEAEAIMAEDKAIDRGERMDFDLSPEAEKAAKKMANVGTKKAPTNYTFERKRKENPTKANIISTLENCLKITAEIACENVKVTNKERVITFKVGDDDYELTLTQKRKPKA